MSKMKRKGKQIKFPGTGNIGNIILILVNMGAIYFRINGEQVTPWKSLIFKAR